MLEHGRWPNAAKLEQHPSEEGDPLEEPVDHFLTARQELQGGPVRPTNARGIAAGQIMPSLGNLGEQYGIQSTCNWQANDNRRQALIDVLRAPNLWRVSVFGDVVLKITWGTGAGFIAENVQTPLVATFPGSVTIEATPKNPATPTEASATLTEATGAGESKFAQLIQGPANLVAQVVRVTALNACVLNVGGVAVALNAGDLLPIISNTTVTSGTLLAHLEA